MHTYNATFITRGTARLNPTTRFTSLSHLSLTLAQILSRANLAPSNTVVRVSIHLTPSEQ